MLSRRRRLRAAEVRATLSGGRSLPRGSYLSGKYIPTPGPLRSAVVVSKKVAKRAVMRNRLRRAAYRALRGAQGSGTAVFFVTKVPPPPLQSAFAADFVTLLTPLA